MSSKSNNIPPHVLESLAQMPPGYAINLPQGMLESLTPERMMTMDFTVMQLKQKAQADGSDEALQEADFICERLDVLEKAHFQFSMRPRLFQESNLNFERLYHDLCDREEAKRGDHKHCSKCKEVPYCSRACQKAHWKVHKRDCCKKKSATGPNKENA